MNKFTNLLSAGKKSIQILIIVLLALIAATSVYLYALGVGSKAESEGQQVSTYIVHSLVPAGLSLQDAISQGLIVEQKMTKSARPADSLSEVNDTNSALVALRDLQPGQIILNSAFGFSVADAGGLPIPDGKIAVSISLPDVSRVAAFVHPGSEVAVFSSVAAKESGGSPTVRVLFQKLLVLAIGNQVSSVQGQTADSNLVTLAVTPLEAEKLIYGSANTTLYFGLLTNSAKLEDLVPIGSTNLFN